MTRACRSCLEPTESPDGYHAACLRDLFGGEHVPPIRLDPGHLEDAIWRMAGNTSISGLQPKLSLRPAHDGSLHVAATGGTYILKPQSPKYPSLPENEHLTMRLASAFGIPVPPLALVTLSDGETAYLIRRYDRDPGGGHKLRQEDFCQLAGKPADEKDQGSAELCVRIARRYVAPEDQPSQLRALFRRFLFAFLCSNGDMHLKNLAVLIADDDRPRLSPAYDLVCTRLVIPDDEMTLPVGGKRDRLRRGTWLSFAHYCGIDDGEAAALLDSAQVFRAPAEGLIARSFLNETQRDAYRTLLLDRLDKLRQ